MKKINLFGLLVASGLLINMLPVTQSKALSQTGGIDFNVGGKGCNSSVQFNPRTQIITLKPGLKLNTYGNLDRISCLLRVSTPTDDKILVPIAVKGNTHNHGGKMTISITTNSGANVLSTMRRSYTTTGGINVAQFFVPSDSPQCGSSGNVGANVSVFGTNAAINLHNIQFKLVSKRC